MYVCASRMYIYSCSCKIGCTRYVFVLHMHIQVFACAVFIGTRIYVLRYVFIFVTSLKTAKPP